jgi:hypothetical protein
LAVKVAAPDQGIAIVCMIGPVSRTLADGRFLAGRHS